MFHGTFLKAQSDGIDEADDRSWQSLGGAYTRCQKFLSDSRGDSPVIPAKAGIQSIHQNDSLPMET